MASFTQLPKTRHQAAIAGKVIDARIQRPVAGVTATITTMPAAFQSWLATRALQHGAGWDKLVERPDRTNTAEDGCFRFVDLPDGNYTVSIELTKNAHRYGLTQQAFAVTRDVNGLIQTTIKVIELPPTGVTGQIKGVVQGQNKALSLAHARVDGSGEGAYSDEQGLFYLTGVELGTRQLNISSVGFQPTTKTVIIQQGTVTNIGIVDLSPAMV